MFALHDWHNIDYRSKLGLYPCDSEVFVSKLVSSPLILPLVAMGLALAACSQADTPASEATAARTAALPDTCKDNPLLPALPEPAAIAGKPLTSVDCQPFSVEMVWGEPGASTSLILVDSQGTDGDTPPQLAQMGKALPIQAAKTAVIMAEGLRETALAYPASLEELGGEDYLTVVKEEASGLKYALDVEPLSSGGQVGSVVGVVRDRYALTLNIEQEIKGITAGQAAYAPWLSALRLEQLP